MRAEEIAVALIAIDNEELFVVGHIVDVQRLYEAGLILRAWDITLDNGHRPCANQKKRLTYDINQAGQADKKNVLTTKVSRHSELVFTYNLHALEHTYLVRQTPAFWSEVSVAFADEDGRLREIGSDDYYALFRGAVSTNGNVRFIRMDADTLL